MRLDLCRTPQKGFLWILVYLLSIIITCLQSKTAAFVYPQYCSKIPLDPATRRSPPLSARDRSRRLTFYQVHLIFRHGARTPSSYQTCWQDYNPVWNCSYNEIIQGTCAAQSCSNPNLSTHDALFRTSSPTLSFRKLYNADPINNIFHGTCERGQLIVEGAQQHVDLGRFVGESYFDVNSSNKLPAPGTPPLFKFSTSPHGTLYIRTTDMQRTRLSAANLVSSMLKKGFGNSSYNGGHPIPVHTMDIENDCMLQSHQHCPALAAAVLAATHDPKYPAMQLRHPDLYQRLQNVFAFSLSTVSWGYQALDCLFPYLCSNRWNDIPDLLRPNGTNAALANSLQQQIINAIDDELGFMVLYNNSRYAKLAISQFTTLLRDILLANQNDKGHQASIHLWSGHDTTLIPILGAYIPDVWDKKWPPYASLITLEVYRSSTEHVSRQLKPYENLWFRLIYNGKLVTHGIHGCTKKDLCNFRYFFHATSWANASAEECKVSPTATIIGSHVEDRTPLPLWPLEYKLLFQPPQNLQHWMTVLFWIGGLLGFVAGIVLTVVTVRVRNLIYKPYSGLLPSRETSQPYVILEG